MRHCRSLFPLILLFLSLSMAQAADVAGPLEYSGWSAADAFRDYSLKAKFNLVADLPAATISHFRLPANIYWEEGMNLLAACCGRQVRKIGSVWLLTPIRSFLEEGAHVTVAKRCHFRPRARLAGMLRSLLFPGMAAWSPPALDWLAIGGTKGQVDEVKKVFETLDTPVHQVRLEFRLEDPFRSTILASWTMPVLSQAPFKVRLVTPSGAPEAFLLEGKARVNDDGWIDSRLHLDLAHAGGTSVLEWHSLATDKEWHQVRIRVGGVNLILAHRGVIENSPWCASHLPVVTAVSPADVATSKNTIGAGSTRNNEPMREHPFLRHQVAVTALLEQLAREADVELLCDASASGTVSVLCHGEEAPTVGDLMEAAARASGLDCYEGRKGVIVGSTRAIRDLVAADREPVQSGELHAIRPDAAIQALTDAFRIFGLAGSCKPGVHPGTVQVTAEPDGERFFRTLTDLWAQESPRFELGCEVILPGGKESGMSQLTRGGPIRRVWTVGTSKVTGQLDQEALDDDDHLSVVGYHLELKNADGGQWRFRGTARPPGPPPHLFLKCEGVVPLEIRWRGQFFELAPEPDPASLVPLAGEVDGAASTREPGPGQAFDDAFDISF